MKSESRNESAQLIENVLSNFPSDKTVRCDMKFDRATWEFIVAALRTSPSETTFKRDAVIEECAKVCDRFTSDQQDASIDFAMGMENGAMHCANNIRALKGRSDVASTACSEAQAALKAALPYLEGMAEKLKIASSSPEVIALHELIVRARMALPTSPSSWERK